MPCGGGMMWACRVSTEPASKQSSGSWKLFPASKGSGTQTRELWLSWGQAHIGGPVKLASLTEGCFFS